MACRVRGGLVELDRLGQHPDGLLSTGGDIHPDQTVLAAKQLRQFLDRTLLNTYNPGDPHPVAASADNVFGIISLIFWSVTIIVTLKDVLLVMHPGRRPGLRPQTCDPRHPSR